MPDQNEPAEQSSNNPMQKAPRIFCSAALCHKQWPGAEWSFNELQNQQRQYDLAIYKRLRSLLQPFPFLGSDQK